MLVTKLNNIVTALNEFLTQLAIAQTDDSEWANSITAVPDFNPIYGICAMLDELVLVNGVADEELANAVDDSFAESIELYSYYSGQQNTPVMPTDEEVAELPMVAQTDDHPSYAMYYCATAIQMWIDGEYARRRRVLLKLIIEHLESRLRDAQIAANEAATQ